MEKKFFAASNSCDGFKNYYGACFARAEHLYIVKGGAGTGKSTFMKRVAKIAEARGYDTEHYFCSSDHTSYDGVLVNTGEECVGIIDGTFPHPYIEKLPGLREEIVNTGMFWDRGVLVQNGDEIRHLTSQKGMFYDNAYSYLRAYGNLAEVVHSFVSHGFDTQKAKKAISGIMKYIPDGEGFSALPTPINSLGMLGEAHLDTYEAMSDRIFLLGGDIGGGEFLHLIYESAKEKGVAIRTAPSVICHKELDGLYFEREKVFFVRESAVPSYTRDNFGDKIKCININRFVSLGEQEKKEIKYCSKLMAQCKDGATEALAEAGKQHFALEQIYKSAMDFPALEEYISDICKKII